MPGGPLGFVRLIRVGILQKLCHNTRPNIPCHNREFFVATEDFEKSVVTKISLSRHKTIRSLSRKRILCHARTHYAPVAQWCGPVLPFCRDTIAMLRHKALTISCRDTVHDHDTESKGLRRDREALCRDPSHPVPTPNLVATRKFCRDTGLRVSVARAHCVVSCAFQPRA